MDVKEYVKACRVEDLKEGHAEVFELMGKKILIAMEKGEVYAIDNTCTHDNGAIGQSRVVQGEVQCPRHGARFDIKSGRATQLPAVMDIKTYKTKVENGDVLVSL